MKYKLVRMTWGVDIADNDAAHGPRYSTAMKLIGETNSITIQDLIPSTTKMLSLDGANLPKGASMRN
jgi:hypothetical protein